MKKIISLTLVLATVLITSCKKEIDYRIPENISGTTWRCDAFASADIEYALLKFTSTTIVEGWTKHVGASDHKDWTGTFVISGSNITITEGSSTYSGIIEGKDIKLTVGSSIFVFTKQ